jgi:malate synthase
VTATSIQPDMAQGVAVLGPESASARRVLVPAALDFVAALHRQFNPRRLELLERRAARQAELDAGGEFDYLAETSDVRAADWRVASAPSDLDNRRVEITGPVDRKMMINALNSGAQVFMADFEDALSPTWDNVVQGQQNLIDAVRRRIEVSTPEGKTYHLNDRTATLVVRPRGWHLVDKHVLVDGAPVAASLLDFGLYLFHNAGDLLDRGSGPYFYLAKLESHHEARLWNDVFVAAQEVLGIPHGSIRATVLIETVAAAFEMDEILYELRDHAAGLNAGRWDYIFSIIKKFRNRPEAVLPDRAQVTMAVPFMRAYTELLVKTCHRRGAHAIGGMAAYIPNRRDSEANDLALARVRDDKLRESGDGFDGTWVAHPDLVPVALEVFQRVLNGRPHQKERLRPEVKVGSRQLADIRVPDGKITQAGVRANIAIALQYLDAWLSGNGAAAINNLMEDTATAEISRAQLWQWLRHSVAIDGQQLFTPALYQRMRDEELASLGGPQASRLGEAAEILDHLVLERDFVDFLTLIAYDKLVQTQPSRRDAHEQQR